MKASLIVPVRNEEVCLERTIQDIRAALDAEALDYEVLIVDDGSTDQTGQIASRLARQWPRLKVITNPGPYGFGLAVRKGLENFSGEAAIIVMGDGADSPQDIVRYIRRLEAGAECVFGSRFVKGAAVRGYPWHKMFLNRLANHFIRILFHIDYNDVTNAFKAYRRNVIDGLKPFLSPHFNLTVEMPLKAIIRGYQYQVIPVAYVNRLQGVSKLKIKEMGSRYLFIVLYLFLEKILSRGDYYRRDRQAPPPVLP